MTADPVDPPLATTGETARRRRTGPRTAPAGILLPMALAGGLAWGATTSGLQTVLPSPWHALANAAAPWAAGAFVAGLFARRRSVAAVAGLLVCWGETLGYYGTSALRGFGVGLLTYFWLAAAVAGGPVFGVAGWLWRWPRPLWSALGAALLASVFVAEGAVVFGVVNEYPGEAVLFCTVGVVLAVGLGLHRRQLLPVLAWCALTLPVGALGVLALTRLIS